MRASTPYHRATRMFRTSAWIIGTGAFMALYAYSWTLI